MHLSHVKYFFVAVFLLAFGIGGYAFFIEPFWLQSTDYKVAFPTLDSPLKIAHVTDLHISKMGKLENAVLQRIREESPDLIVLTGDIVDRASRLGEAGTFLSQLSAPFGVYAVNGNWENWSLNVQQLRELAQAPSPVFLDNQSVQIRKDVWIVGQDDLLSGRARPDKAFAGVPEEAFCLGLFHSPEAFSQGGRQCDLNLAGHTHGGQIKIPLFGPLWLPPGSGEFISGWYETDKSKLYVSRGVGTSLLPIRFLSRPEVTFITIVGGTE